MVGIWHVLADEDRHLWLFVPFESVGPLTFGMTPRQVEAAVDGVLVVVGSHGLPGEEKWTTMCDERSGAQFAGSAVTAYYDTTIGLAAVAIDALVGPQVTYQGTRLVGCTPSHLENRFASSCTARGWDLRYSQTATPCVPALGLVLRAQRAGDVVLSRPVMVARPWADRCWDTTEGPIPPEEWATFEG
jgi:hypothetical protein